MLSIPTINEVTRSLRAFAAVAAASDRTNASTSFKSNFNRNISLLIITWNLVMNGISATYVDDGKTISNYARGN